MFAGDSGHKVSLIHKVTMKSPVLTSMPFIISTMNNCNKNTQTALDCRVYQSAGELLKVAVN